MTNLSIFAVEDLLTMEPEKLLTTLLEDCDLDLPISIESIDDMKKIEKILSSSSAYYSFFSNLALTAKLQKRSKKRSGASKEEIEDVLSREEIFSLMSEKFKNIYNTASRMITVRQQILEETKMI